MKTLIKSRSEVFYINILIVALFLSLILVTYITINQQLESVTNEVKNTITELENNIKSGVDSVFYLKTAVDEIYKVQDKLGLKYAPKVHVVDNKGNYALDIPDMANLTGYDGLKSDKKILLEMEMSIELTPYMKIINQLNKDYAWVYYISKYNFYTMYPYVPSKDFVWNYANAQEPLWQKALPKNNPKGEFFFTPLYFDGVGLGLMVTLGYPIYYMNEFLGTIDLDITLKSQSDFLNKMNLHNGTYFISNKEGQIIASSGIEGFNDKKIFLSKNTIDKGILSIPTTNEKLLSIQNKYLYVKKIDETPWTIYYYKDRVGIYANALYYIFAILLIIIILSKVKFLLNKLYDAHIKIRKTSTNLVVANKQIRKSISFASLIQETFNYDEKVVSHFFNDYFVILKQKDVVGGDIVLFEALSENECLLMNIDCTSHGVPGAFVTMIVKTLQRQIVTDLLKSKQKISPSKILKRFNYEIKHLLNQTSKSSKSNVGFDGQVLYYNKSKNIIKFSSARNDLIFFSNDKASRIRGDRHSVGYKDSDENFEFKEHTVDINNDVTLYLYSDGFPDQLGGVKSFPFGNRKTMELLQNCQNMSMKNQQEYLLNKIKYYQNKNEQNDDISFVGLKINK